LNPITGHPPVPEFQFRGVIPILSTPFHDDESLDLESMSRLVGFMRRLRVDAVTVLGVLGETDRLTEEERRDVVRATIEAAGPVPVIVGASRAGTAATIAAIKDAKRLGASAAMVAPADTNSVPYFRRVGDAGLPLIVQDHPASSGIQTPTDTLLRIVREVPSVAGIKCEAVPTPPKFAGLKEGMSKDRDVPVLTGLGALYARFDLERGSDGLNTGFAFPEVLRAMLGTDGAAVYQRFLPLIVFEQQPGTTVRKEILRRRGLITSNRVRAPGTTIDPGTAKQVEALLSEFFAGVDITQPLPPTAISGPAGHALATKTRR
jgi:4-hydroxy-tetrahydrodipicolinate synthase